MMHFRLKPKTGQHTEGKKTYKAGDVVASERDLAKIFPFKFEKVTVLPSGAPSVAPPQVTEAEVAASAERATSATSALAPAAPTPVLPAVVAPAVEPPSPPPVVPPVDSTVGRDVTKRFPKAKEQDFKVFAVPGGFNVYDVDDLKTTLNKAPLKTRKDVGSFVEQCLKGT